ncbi:MAG: hypothetical protein E3J72_18025 [Planctomycetota bacterium]|nr:MAG: hypothetical protein E3J72_18025 [Planctomycetota bacterium]
MANRPRTPMTPMRLAAFRLFNVTFGRIGAFARLLRRRLERKLIYRGTQRYVPSSRFFHFDELED